MTVGQFFWSKGVIITGAGMAIFLTLMLTRFIVSHNPNNEALVTKSEKEKLDADKKAGEKKKSSDEFWESVRNHLDRREEALEKSYQKKREELEAQYKKKNKELEDAYGEKNKPLVQRGADLDKREASFAQREGTSKQQVEGANLLIKQAEQAKKEADEKKAEVQKMIEGEIKNLLEKKRGIGEEVRRSGENLIGRKRKELASLERNYRLASTQQYQNTLGIDIASLSEDIAYLQKKLKDELKYTEEDFDAVIKRLRSLSS